MKIALQEDKDSRSDLAVIPPASLSLADVLFVLILIPLMDKIIYPWLDRKGWKLSVFNRISIGKYDDLCQMYNEILNSQLFSAEMYYLAHVKFAIYLVMNKFSSKCLN